MFSYSSKLMVGALVLLLAGATGALLLRRATNNAVLTVAGGWDAYRLNDYNRAAIIFEAVAQSSAAQTEERLQALYGAAVTWGLRTPGGDREKAERFYRALLAENAQHDLAAWSLLGLARLQHLLPVGSDPDYEKVRAAYQECIARFPFHLAGEEALIYQQSTLVASVKSTDALSAQRTLTVFLEAHPHSPFRGAAHALLAECYTTLRNPDEMLKAKISALESQPRDELSPGDDRAAAYWNLAVAAEFDAGDLNTARKYYKLMIAEYPMDFRKFGAIQALRRMDELEMTAQKQSTSYTSSPPENSGERSR